MKLYHGSMNKFTQFKPSNSYRKSFDDRNKAIPLIFLTSSKKAAQQFADEHWCRMSNLERKKHSMAYIYHCELTTNKLFDFSNPSLMKEFINAIDEDFVDDFNKSNAKWLETLTLEGIIEELERLSFREIENYAVQNLIQLLGYDGFITREKNADNVGIYDADNIIIKRIEKVPI